MDIGFSSDAAITILGQSFAASLLLFGQWLFGATLFLFGFFVITSVLLRCLGPWAKVEEAYPLRNTSEPTRWLRCYIKAGNTTYKSAKVGISESGVRMRIRALCHREVQIPWNSVNSVEIQTLQFPLWRRFGRNLETYLCVIEVLEPVDIRILCSASKAERLVERYAGEKVSRATYTE